MSDTTLSPADLEMLRAAQALHRSAAEQVRACEDALEGAMERQADAERSLDVARGVHEFVLGEMERRYGADGPVMIDLESGQLIRIIPLPQSAALN